MRRVGVFFQRTGEVDEVAVGFGSQSGIGQPRADALRDIERGGALGKFLVASIGKLDMNVVCHKFGNLQVV